MKHKTGSLELICGSMFSGKTEELIRRLRRATIAKQKVQVFKPSIDDRYGVTKVASHNGEEFEAVVVDSVAEMLMLLHEDTSVVAIDEVQFFERELVDVVQGLADKGRRVIMAGLDMDFRGEEFGIMPKLLSVSEKISKLHAICMVCAEEACRTQRLVDGQPAHYNDPIILVGASESYEARCRRCHEVPRD